MAKLYIDVDKIYNNAKRVVEISKQQDIDITGVVKQCDADCKVAKAMVEAGCTSLAVSRTRQAKKLKNAGIEVPIWLIRVPAISELEEVIEYTDIVLITELKTIKEINKLCIKKNKILKLILMLEIGDLREGFYPDEELINSIKEIMQLSNVVIEGIGMNASCYGSVIPSIENTSKLVSVGKKVESVLGRKLNIYSGGNTTSLILVKDKTIPKEINNLRVGESILLARDLSYLWKKPIENTYTDTFVLKAEVIEVKEKPSKPIGETFYDAFGKQPNFEDEGIRKRALVSVGKVDFLDEQGLIPKDKGIKVLGSSTDYLILDIHNAEKNINVGDWLEFEITFACMYSVSTSKDIKIIYKERL